MMNSLMQTGLLASLLLGWVNTAVPARCADLLLPPREFPGGRKMLRTVQFGLCLVPSLLCAFLQIPVFSVWFYLLQLPVLGIIYFLLYRGKVPLRAAGLIMAALALGAVLAFWSWLGKGVLPGTWQMESAVLCIEGMSSFLCILVLFTLFEWKGKGKRPGISIFLMMAANGLPAGLLSGHLYRLISQQQEPDSISLIFYLACYALVITFFSVFFFQKSKNRAWNALEEARQLAVMQEEYSQSLQRHAVSLQEMQDDCARTARMTADLVRSGQTAEAQKMLEELSERIKTTRPALFSPSPIVNAILSQKKALCENKGIVFEHELMLQERPDIQDLDLCIALGNLMDNAIRNAALMEPEQRRIHLSARLISGYLVIRCENPYQVESRGKIQHTGFGHQILQDLARRYDGTFESDAQDSGVFSATLCLASQGAA